MRPVLFFALRLSSENSSRFLAMSSGRIVELVPAMNLMFAPFLMASACACSW